MNDCPICGDNFTGEKGVRDHIWDVHSACSYCGDQFDNLEELYTHWLEVHEAALSKEGRKRAETRVGDRTVCPICSERFGSDDGVRDHAWESHNACHYCGDQFDDEATLHAHWLAVHEGDLTRTDRKRAAEEVGTLSFGDRLTHQGPVGALTESRLSRRALIGGGTAGLLALIGDTVVNRVLQSSQS